MQGAKILRAAVGVLVATAAVAISQAAVAGKKNDTLTVAVQREVRNVDGLYTNSRHTLILMQLTDDGLVYVDPTTFKYKPAIAKSFKYIDDTTLEFEIRQNVKFHDGSPLTADDVIYTYDWVLKKESGSRQTKKLQRWLESIEKLGPYKVRMKLKRAYPLALRDAAVSIQLRKKGSYHGDGKANKDAQSLQLNGTGPYKIVKFDPGKKVVLERFDGYYADSPKGRPAIKNIVFRTIPDWGTQQAEAMSGGIDWMYNVPTEVAETMANAPRTKLVPGPSMRIGFISMDSAGKVKKDSPFKKLEVRQAMIHAINRESIVKHLVKGSSKVIHSVCHPVQFGCSQNVTKYEYDPAKAKALLKKAGYADGVEFDFWAYRERSVSEAIAADLRKAGFKPKFRYVKSSVLGRARRSNEVQSYFGTWGSGSTADAAAIVSVHWTLENDRNLTEDPDVAEQVVAAEASTDPEVRKAAYDKALGLIADRALAVPLYAFTLNYIASKDLDFQAPGDGLPRLFRAKWK